MTCSLPIPIHTDRLIRCERLTERLVKEGWTYLSEGTAATANVLEKDGQAAKIPYEIGNNEREYSHLVLVETIDRGLAPTNPQLTTRPEEEFADLVILETNVIPGAPLEEALEKGRLEEVLLSGLREGWRNPND